MNYIQADWPAPSHIKAYTTTRNGWHSRVEQPAPANQPLNVLLPIPTEPIWVTQTHSAIAIEATLENKGQVADATFTTQANQVCAVETADCLPILLCSKQGRHVAAIHAGWRGLAGGIIEATLTSLDHPAHDVLAWLGPAISQPKYEVGIDVYDAFTKQHPESASAFLPHAEGKWLADLYALARIRLKRQGVTQVYGGQFCTYTQDELFFSARRDKTTKRKMASIIWISEN